VASALAARGARLVRRCERWEHGRNTPEGRYEARLTSAHVRLLALRGAITCDENTKQEVEEKTQRLVKELLARNELEHEDLVSLIFTATEDLTAEFPAAAARAVGLGDIPLLCARELAIEGGKPMCIRLLVHCYTDRPRDQLHHVYLDGARSLRDDLPE
jgi:chorismate mutase